MTKLAFDIKNRVTGAVQFTAQIECDEGASLGVKRGLAARWAYLTRADLTGAYLTGANLTRADLTGAYLTRANLSGANLTRAELTGANLTRAYLTRADLSGANLTRAYLTRANLSGANLTRAELTGAYLSGANLTRAELTGAYLTGADLTGADLTGANLTGAELTGADLTGADLTGANLTGAKILHHTVFYKIPQVQRDDGYSFLGLALAEGGILICAGCRTMLIEEYRDHIAKSYPDTDKAVETLAILAFIESRYLSAREGNPQ
jgi:uncharacterized protein YjbI with pentapeptide repeats